jgi:hypothetical protein
MIQKGNNILTEHSKNRLKFDGELKQINFLDTRVYQRAEDKFYPSVTSILQYFPKDKFFETWIKDVGHNADIIMRRAGDEGTQVHNAVEKLVEGEELNWMDEYGNARYNQNVWEMILKFADFWQTYKPELIHSEQFVYSDTYEYAGPADLIVKLDGQIWLIDLKTSNTLHDSFDLQVSAYAQAFTELTGEKIDRTGILWLKSMKRGDSKKEGVYQGKGWELKPVDNTEENMEMFMSVYKIYKIKNKDFLPKYKTYPTTIKL